ncbi:aminotransferase class IV [Corynebacterium lizhenjunii]|uniref:aminotransferase class IV n=1 Tax=Corynebacterium lizhenjunii TaxID=2709394 RepID=UPI0013E9C8E3|nr:aminotransferase class IV [Corynebacterium lizhenjunii]
MMLVDSFLVRDGRVVRPDLHRQRFEAAGGTYPDLRGSIPERGEWFPRISGHLAGVDAAVDAGVDAGVDAVAEAATGVSVKLRPAPPLRSATRLWIGPEEDPRVVPQVKGPDLGVLAELRARAVALGADDALLYRGGVALEAANAAVMFIDGGEAVLPPQGETLLSTTVVATLEAGLLPRVQRRQVSIAQALRLPAFAASALHGWTPVTHWIGAWGQVVAPRTEAFDAAAVNAALWEQATPL